MDLPPTLVHALQDRADLLGDRPALWTRRGATYLPTSWREYARRVRHAALGLVSLGLAAGERVALVAGSREEALVLELAVMAAGGVPVALAPQTPPGLLRAQLAQVEAAFLVAETAGQAAQALEGAPRLSSLRRVLVLEGAAGGAPDCVPYGEVLARGRASDEGPYWARVNALRPEGPARLAFTAGTTGEPRAVVHSHAGLLWTARKLAQALGLTERERFLSFLPRAHLAEQLASLQLPLLLGAQVFFAPPDGMLPEDFREVRPSVVFGTARDWEELQARVEEELQALSPRRGELLAWARRTALHWHLRDLEDEPIPTALQAQYALARRLVFEPMRERLGLDRTRLFLTAGAVRRDVLEFLLSLDVVVREAYGLTEAGGPVAVSLPGATRPGRQGRPLLGVEVKVAPDGELLVRSGGTCLGYWGEPQATAALREDGWLPTGDVGRLDDEGYLRFGGRKAELLLSPGGRRISPSRLEALLDALPPVEHAVVLGGRGRGLVALVTLAPRRALALARAHGWPTEPGALATHPGFLAHLDAQVATLVNRRVSKAESIRKVAVLPERLSVEAGEVTLAGTVRREVVAARHQALVEALLGGEPVPPRRSAAG